MRHHEGNTFESLSSIPSLTKFQIYKKAIPIEARPFIQLEVLYTSFRNFPDTK